MSFLYVGLGGFLGAVTRYSVGLLASKYFPNTALPLGTISVNVIGSFLIGILFAYLQKSLPTDTNLMNHGAYLFLVTGILGGFTTFSAFSLETVNLISQGKTMLGALYILLSVALCLLGVWLGKSMIA